MDPMAREAGGGTILRVRVTPRSSRTRIVGTREGTLLVALTAAPVDGAANAALTRFLGDQFRIPRRDVTLLAGTRGRTKRVKIAGLSAAEVERRLEALLATPAR